MKKFSSKADLLRNLKMGDTVQTYQLTETSTIGEDIERYIKVIWTPADRVVEGISSSGIVVFDTGSRLDLGEKLASQFEFKGNTFIITSKYIEGGRHEMQVTTYTVL
jgi:hypothetical protein